MNFYFRCNFGSSVGIGHLMRTIKLCNILKKKGHSTKIFIDKKTSFLKKFSFEYEEMYPKKFFFSNQNLDAKIFIQKTISKIKNKKTFIIVDDYRLDSRWEKKIANKLKSKIISIDDFENRKHFSDFIINPKSKYYHHHNSFTLNHQKKKCTYLLGPRYSIISKIVKKNKYKKFTVVFNFGGSGNLIYVCKIIKHFEDYFKFFINFKIIVGPFSKNKGLLYRFANKKKNISLIEDNYNLAEIYSKSHLFVGAVGTALYEVTAQKLPAIFFQISKNQETSLESLEKMGQRFYFESKYLLDKNLKKISQLIFLIKKNYFIVLAYIENSKLKIDDKGAERIIYEILGNKKKIKNNLIKKKKNFLLSDKYRIIKCGFEDINYYIDSRNRVENINQSFKKRAIDKLDHYLWWFKNNTYSFKLIKNKAILIYLYHRKITINNKFFLLSGWFTASNKCSIHDLMYALNWQRKMNLEKKIDGWISFVKKNNRLAQQYSKRLGWKEVNNSDFLAKQIYKKLKIPKCIIYIRN